MKKLSLLVSLLLFGACSNKEEAAKTDETVVTTIGMIADVSRQIAGDHQEIINLIGEGIDPHMHQPSKSEIDKIQRAGLVLYNGLFLEGKMGTILKNRADQGNPVSAVAEGIEIQVMGSSVPDPHLWMDVSIWSKVAKKIGDELAAFDSKNADEYQKRRKEYQIKLNDLHTYALMVFPTIPKKQRVLVTAHDAFSYLGRAYGIEVRGIQGISTESEAGTKDINDLVTYLVDNKIPAIFVESSVRKVSQNSNRRCCRERSHRKNRRRAFLRRHGTCRNLSRDLHRNDGSQHHHYCECPRRQRPRRWIPKQT
jgi:manganese/zinc/iron transport system substrate-binding protein